MTTVKQFHLASSHAASLSGFFLCYFCSIAIAMVNYQ